ncbi:D-alanyl-D-alanine carboxypeptidase [Geodermatophilus telluris]|uniref:D-alanyl-D-alanine carboxypeptidase n=1 Tax=Geodermatophilus telluris TaxID=1190417 RepID=A0A1G6ICU8_9ACTN|nr:serine hydrolase domain-containing protein [Geodermatophilus telluris]SDC03576.1 D-alanyl-D-alanine carboxypeptidase [Geodermatophilus telluris]
MTGTPTAAPGRGQLPPVPAPPAGGRRLGRTLAAAALLAALTVASACGGAAPPAVVAAAPDPGVTTPSPVADADLERTVTAILEAHRADQEFVGAVLAVRRADGATVTATSGTPSLDVDGPVDPSVPWNVGSVTKTFVAVVVLQLAEEGRLDLDAGIDGFLPDLPGADRITPRQLLQHTSGLGEYLDQPAVLTDAQREWTPAELIAVAEAAGRRGDPGGAHAYSNTNYVVLGEIVGQVTGHPWADEVRDRVVEPLGLRHTRLGALRGTPGYGVEETGFVDLTDCWHPTVGGAAGGLESTAADLLVFAGALRDGRLLSGRSQAEMRTFVPAEDWSRFGIVHEYGLGLERYTTGQLTVEGHMGVGAAHSAFTGFDRDSGAAVAVVLNTRNPGPQAAIGLEALAAVGG